MKIHKIKLKKEFFDAVAEGRKTFEVRYNDRDYQEGDAVIMQEVDGSEYTKPHRFIKAEIGYVLKGFGLLIDYVAFSLIDAKEIKDETAETPAEPCEVCEGKQKEDFGCFVCIFKSETDEDNRLWEWLDEEEENNYCPNCGRKL
jgi:hypothetical protein